MFSNVPKVTEPWAGAQNQEPNSRAENLGVQP